MKVAALGVHGVFSTGKHIDEDEFGGAPTMVAMQEY